MRSAYAWALGVAVLSADMPRPWSAAGALLTLALLIAGDREERRERAGAEDPRT